ncbi:MAG TPA: MgtC/SapB family protein [Dehalococcoidia bacterium]|jgi:putative Mg2+ transporter-C (MgtC) family protein|nr:MgtC/SapB family protein [Dehalococcoidia bacterium]
MDVSTGDQLEILGRLVLAGFLGALIGLERELRGYPAGIRTLALVAVGSALFTDVSRLMGGDDRVAAQIVTGIGFIGAGVIFREGYTVRGITTAATIWSAAAVGMAVGIELYVVGVLGAIFVFAVLEARPLTRRIDDFLRRVGGELREEQEENGETTDQMRPLPQPRRRPQK